jgi:hypothetical protein
LLKTILAWRIAQIQFQNRLHVGSPTLDPIPRLAAQLKLYSAPPSRLAADNMVGGSHYADVSADWLLTWHATVHDDAIITSCWRHHHAGQSRGLGQLVFGSGKPIRTKKTRGSCWRAWAASSLARVAMSHVRILRRFHQCGVSSSSSKWYGKNSILTIFIF